MQRVFLAVDASTADLTPDDQLLAEALERRGVAVRPLPWGTRVSPGDVVVIRSTWDYVDRPTSFLRWLDHLDEGGAAVVNPTRLLRWNHHKRYLLDLQRRGVPIVPTVLVSRGDARSLGEISVERGWTSVVVKPAIAGTARSTVHSGLIGDDAARVHLAELVEREDALVQPVVDSIRVDGEVSVLALAGTPLAAVRKTASYDEWRVQSEFGGTARAVDLTPDLASVARRTLDAIVEQPVYARIDVADLGGHWVVMELELVEPELFFRLHPMLAEELADLLVPLVE